MSHQPVIDPAYPVPTPTLTDLYQITMANGYWKTGRADDRAVFSLFYRTPPKGSGYVMAAGLERVIDFISNYHFAADDLAYLATLPGVDGQPLFEPGFIDYLRNMRMTLDISAMPEGTLCFPHEPIIRVEGPIIACQLIETTLLNLVNFSSLIATVASQIVSAAPRASVLEFGLRRAQGPDGALTASRSAYLGGFAATSNVLAGKLFGIPVKGTHAHSWVLSFPTESESFEAYLNASPNNGTLLVDTYDTLTGVRHAIAAANRTGHPLVAIRLDSGDLAYLSRQARKELDESGFGNTKIIASNDLDAATIEALYAEGACIDVPAVGTRVATAWDQPALGGVYKLTAIAGTDGAWRTPVKLSSDMAKLTVPGKLGVRRFYARNGQARADMIFDELETQQTLKIVDPADRLRRVALDPKWSVRELLEPIFVAGSLVYEVPSLADAREYAARELASFDESIKRRLNPHRYPAGLEANLARKREEMVLDALDERDLERAA